MERATDDYGHYSPLDEPRCASSLCPKNGPNEGMRTSTAPISWIFCVSFAGKSGRRSSTFTGYLAYLCHVICPWLDDAGVRRASDLTARRLSSKSIFDISVFFVFFEVDDRRRLSVGLPMRLLSLFLTTYVVNRNSDDTCCQVKSSCFLARDYVPWNCSSGQT